MRSRTLLRESQRTAVWRSVSFLFPYPGTEDQFRHDVKGIVLMLIVLIVVSETAFRSLGKVPAAGASRCKIRCRPVMFGTMSRSKTWNPGVAVIIAGAVPLVVCHTAFVMTVHDEYLNYAPSGKCRLHRFAPLGVSKRKSPFHGILMRILTKVIRFVTEAMPVLSPS